MDIRNLVSIAIKNALMAGMTKDFSAGLVNMVEELVTLGEPVMVSQRRKCLKDVRKIMVIAKWMVWSPTLNANQAMIMLGAVSVGQTLLTAINRGWTRVLISLVLKRLLFVPHRLPLADRIKTMMLGFAMLNVQLIWRELVLFVGGKSHKAGSIVEWEQQNLHKFVEKLSSIRSQVLEISLLP